MTENEITEEFLRLFSRGWEDPAAHQGFWELREKVSGQGQWPEIVDARLMTLEKKTAESIALLKEILALEPGNVCASLLLASILCRDNDQPEEAIAVYDSLLHHGFKDQEQPDWLHALTLFRKGWTLGEMGKSEEAIRVCDGVVERYGESTDLVLRDAVARALFNKGVRLGQMGKDEEVIRVCDGVVERYGESTDLVLREAVARALVNKGVALGRIGKSEEAIIVYDEVVERFSESADLPHPEAVARALVNKGVALGQMGKLEEATGVYDEVAERFGQSEESAVREVVARALLYKAESLLDADCGDEARALFTKVEKDYFHSEELRSKLASYYDYLRSRFASRGEPQETEQDKSIPDTTKKPTPRLVRYLDDMLTRVDREKQKKFFDKMDEATKRTDGFIRDGSQLSSDFPFLLVLREWNSYTPVIPAEEESDRGGGYFIRHEGEGIVIDPGYDFIENFYRAGGRLCDIDHVIVTHAHDDHTAELEALLMLLHRRWKTKNLPKKPVSLYLSGGVARKFAGLLDLRDAKYKRVITLCPKSCPNDHEVEQQVGLNDKTKLTVLPAYHDDVITQNTAVGLAFEFATNDGDRRVAFTGDWGLYPLKLDKDGKKIYRDDDETKENPMLDTREEMALYNRYPRTFFRPDLLVAHIGSIKRSEFRDKKELHSSGDEGRWYYDNHLGLLGTLTMLHQLNPAAAVISEFGSELKQFRFDLVDILRMALHALQNRGSLDERLSFVIPGDLTIAYDIANRRFLCHETCEFADPRTLCFRPALGYAPKWDANTGTTDPTESGTSKRTYLFLDKTSSLKDGAAREKEDNGVAKKYYRKLLDHELPYHKK